jgi:sporulation protein YlmC with PRC-barrel domain
MSRLMTSVALAALMALAVPGARAADESRDTPKASTEQTNTAHQQGATATNPSGSDQIKPDQMRASKIIGGTVYDRNNAKIGDVKDLVLDKDGKVADVVLDVGGFLGMGGKHVAVKMSDIKTDNNRLTLDRTKDELQQAANYQLEDKGTGAGTSASPVHGGRAGSAAGSGMSGASTPPLHNPPQHKQ